MTELEKAMKNLADAMADLARRDAESTEELKRSIAESRRESEANRRETDARIAAAVERMDDLDGKFRNRLGDLTEKLLVPGIRVLMERCGHDFTRLAPNEEFYVRKGVRFAEIDLFLENPTEAMAVEVKTHMSEKDVDKHMERLESLRAHEEIAGVKGKKLYGAMAGLKIDKGARELALERGLYVVEMIEDTKHVNVVEPPAGVRGW
jgi:predicted RecB family endonuclease